MIFESVRFTHEYLGWEYQYGYMINSLGYHLIHSNPSAELIDHLSQLSWGIVLDDIRLYRQQFRSAFLDWAWFAPGDFISAIDSYVCHNPFKPLNSVIDTAL